MFSRIMNIIKNAKVLSEVAEERIEDENHLLERQQPEVTGAELINLWKQQNTQDFKEEVEANNEEVEAYYRKVEAALSAFFDTNEDPVEEVWVVPSTGLLKVSFAARKKAQHFIWRCDENNAFKGRGIEEKLIGLGWKKHTFTMTDGTSVNWFQLEMAP